ncbi:YkgJ family cysteine cluster protein [Thermodesulfobacteriota bacterium]
MNNNMIQLSLKDTFRFSCHSEVPCFNACCKDLNQSLTPYDIIRLKNHLGLTSGVFLERYTSQHIGPESGLPIITLKFESSHDLRCPFVAPSGCRVYKDRPSSCRSYPLALAASRSRATGEIVEQYLLLREPHCLGFEQDRTQTVEEWLEGQGIPIYNRLNNLLLEILSLKNRLNPGPLDIRSGHLFHLACYDLDNFRIHIFEKGLLEDRNLDSATLDAIENDDVALLKLGIEWIKRELFDVV